MRSVGLRFLHCHWRFHRPHRACESFQLELGTNDLIAFLSNPNVFKYSVNDLVTSPVAPSTIGIISYVYCGYKRINETFNCV